MKNPARLLLVLAAVQGIYYVLTGAWSIVHLASFEAVSGPKADDWLVRTVGVLVGVVGAVLLVGAVRLRVGFELALLALGCAAGLAAIDLIYVLNGTISQVYLLDAAAEIALVVGWLAALVLARHELMVWGAEVAPPRRRGAGRA